eukprot:TRINITY_DN8913_c0_g2_i1.p2 TRINITY_DN8913_c0_g2~~TRINITY_DN8913_c0_g2_i1.p2  ORF type:complete len:280 (+),score=127.88 TRINITY_DN8913_c0_g2_i1:46-840(+)
MAAPGKERIMPARAAPMLGPGKERITPVREPLRPKPKQRRKPFGYDVVMMTTPSFVFICFALMAFMFWWQSVELDALVGRETTLQYRRTHGGDQFLANTPEGYLVKVKLRGIDAPELEQSFGRQAEEALHKKLTAPHADIVAYIYDRDHEGLYVADVFTQHGIFTEFRYVQSQMVEEGMAWHFGLFDKQGRMKELQENASAAGVGLWQEHDPTPPWKFKRQQQNQRMAQRRQADGRQQRSGDAMRDELKGSRRGTETRRGRERR